MKFFYTISLTLSFLFLVSLSGYSQKAQNFDFDMLQEKDTRIDLSDKIYILHYFRYIEYDEAKDAIFFHKFPPQAFSKSLKRLLARPDISHLKRDYSKDPLGVIDRKYYQELPFNSIKGLAENYFSKFSELEKIQQRNASNINKVIQVDKIPNFLRLKNSEVTFNFSVTNMSPKEISKVYGRILVSNSYGEVIISGNYALEEGPYKSLSLPEFKKVLDQTNWIRSDHYVKTEVNEHTIEEINKTGASNLLLKYEPTRVIFTDGTTLIEI